MRGEIEAIRQTGELIVMREVIEVLLLLQQLVLDLAPERDVVAPEREQRAASSITRSSTNAPIGTMSPVSSATPMKRPGATKPCNGCRQRSSASSPVTRCDSMSMIGW
jgi:hypothetical protein